MQCSPTVMRPNTALNLSAWAPVPFVAVSAAAFAFAQVFFANWSALHVFVRLSQMNSAVAAFSDKYLECRTASYGLQCLCSAQSRGCKTLESKDECSFFGLAWVITYFDLLGGSLFPSYYQTQRRNQSLVQSTNQSYQCLWWYWHWLHRPRSRRLAYQ